MADPVDAVLFDLDDTLCSYRRSTEELLAASFDAVGVDPLFPPSAYYERFAAFLGDHDTMAAFRAACFADAARAHGSDPELAREVAAVFEARRDQTAVDPLPGAVDAVRALADEHALGLVTNGPPDAQTTKLGALGLADAFETTVFAGFDAPVKPAPDPFERALSALGVPADRAVMVGNSPTSDVAGARAAGLRAAWLREEDRSPDEAPAYVLDSMRELSDPPWR
jgi:HAD superfamily hydrolase (TIGR01549 family)